MRTLNDKFDKMEFSADRQNDYNPINSLVLLCIVYGGQFMNGLSTEHMDSECSRQIYHVQSSECG